MTKRRYPFRSPLGPQAGGTHPANSLFVQVSAGFPRSPEVRGLESPGQDLGLALVDPPGAVTAVSGREASDVPPHDDR